MSDYFVRHPFGRDGEEAVMTTGQINSAISQVVYLSNLWQAKATVLALLAGRECQDLLAQIRNENDRNMLRHYIDRIMTGGYSEQLISQL